MAGGLVGLLDDIAALAKLAAASIDDVGAAAGRASVKAAGVVVDDAAVTPTYVRGLAAKRELPIIRKIALGSLRNKLLFILPAAMALSAISGKLVEIVLMCGGTYLCFEGAEKLHHRVTGHGGPHSDAAHSGEADGEPDPEDTFGPEHEAKTIAGAIRTDFILSAEIMVIALKEVLGEAIASRVAILAVVAVVITLLVYGVVALIVKMDDVGLRMVETGGSGAQKIGRVLVAGMPKVLSVLSTVGIAAMLWVGGHILLVGAAELGWHGPEDLLHSIEEPLHEVAGVGGVLGWGANTFVSAVVGVAVGFLVVTTVTWIRDFRAQRKQPA
ncbi:MAG: DUF808 domain-containing protein [Microthrixaceae bacterium]|nr:DUF808 domain-containing protein [Microthrixaceae bacterium]